jgi:hypothetical protein
MVVSFMMRCTSPIGFFFLIIYKIIHEKAFFTFLLAGVIVAVPAFLACFGIDSYFYGKLTFVPLNFYIVNIV